ncbi:MAG: ATPase [Acidobacteria bacterium]|nr:ATPase [Acidobacteriota bacterium]
MARVDASPRIALVCGDVTMDWNLARTRRADGAGQASWSADDSTRAYWQRGGAALLADLVEAAAAGLRPDGSADVVLRQTAAPRGSVSAGDRSFHHSYAIWSAFKYSTHPAQSGEKPAWRVQEFLGLDRAAPDAPRDWQKVPDDDGEADVIVVDDADLGYRDREELWPRALAGRSNRRPWIVLKMARPVAQGGIWERLHRDCADRLIVVMTVNDLRLSEVQITRELSWERTSQDLAWELVHNPRVNALAQCAYVIVSFDTAGALLLCGRGRQRGAALRCKSRLVFDPNVFEGAWAAAYPGGMIGYTSTLTTAVARELMRAPEHPDLTAALQNGLRAMRALHREGYGLRGTVAGGAELAFPIDRVVREMSGAAQGFSVIEVQDPVRFLTREPGDQAKAPEGGFWAILEDRYTDTLAATARRIVLEGAEAVLEGVPLGQFGKLLTVDRREIESFRSIRALVSEYCRQARPKRPLSIAVFGAPGSGKSFGISEVARSLLPDQIKVLEFNLSQFERPDDLLDAFHQIRDAGLAGQIPLVFWDEFDTALGGQPLGWLRHFLAPMQDGRFQQGQMMHPIGRSIFVFAGGTSAAMADFGEGVDSFRTAKGPDFVSRLKGYVNILGPNQMRGSHGSSDAHFIIRRAILLRSILQRDARHLFEKKGGKDVLSCDPGVLRALLHTREFKHGVRSMESLIAMSQLAGKTRFERSCLPAGAQLSLHVNDRDFLARVQEMDLEGELLDRLAAAAHDIFCDELRARGFRHGARTNEAEKRHSSLMPYEALPEDEKEQNRGNVRDIASKLTEIGYVMMPARSNEPPFDFPGVDLERLAEMEHDRWLRAKIQVGWKYGRRTDKARRIHSDLVPWRKLSRAERSTRYQPYELAAMGPGALGQRSKDKDRALVRGIPTILARAGYTVVRASESP